MPVKLLTSVQDVHDQINEIEEAGGHVSSCTFANGYFTVNYSEMNPYTGLQKTLEEIKKQVCIIRSALDQKTPDPKPAPQKKEAQASGAK